MRTGVPAEVHFRRLLLSRLFAMSEATIPFEAAARAVSRAVLDYLIRYVGNPTVAEDLLQETLIRMDRGLGSFEGRASIKTWAFSIASRVAADYLRHPERQTQVVELEEAEAVADPATGADERLVIGEMDACIRRTIDTLPDSYRTALILHDLEGLTAEQVAEIGDCSLATAKIRIHRARQRLKDALANRCTFYRDEDAVFRCDQKQKT
ncbi:RNA polymerase sigma-70 factor (ECF subfamily) [Panacagrimonas perspica]|uniref:RNA polymerase sigma-70 factor (ECF subfamily) n=2 Tax=Panacagrimonas perspica TaxID=381431 RepID=A0A4R7PDM0_9GAMM|nr:RNA polymerase sigma-70 factor (ECF subfamily) [Panacagrimonas perspica]